MYRSNHEKQSSGAFRKEGNVLFNNALNTFYCQLYGIRHMVKDNADSERGNLLLPHASSHRQDNIPWPLLHQLWRTGWNEKWVHEGLIC